MLATQQARTNLGVGLGILLQVVGLVLSNSEGYAASWGVVLLLLGVAPFIWGCMNYAEGKGHSKWVGLVGVAGIIGLIVLVVLPDQCKRTGGPE